MVHLLVLIVWIVCGLRSNAGYLFIPLDLAIDKKRRIKKDDQLKLRTLISCFQVTPPAVCLLSYTTPDWNATETRWVSLFAFWHVVAYCFYTHSIVYQTYQGWSAWQQEVWYQNIWRSRARLCHACTVFLHSDDTGTCHTYSMIIFRQKETR